jgi:hypothetical protein
MADSFNNIRAILAQSKIQKDNPALYQAIHELIKSSAALETTVIQNQQIVAGIASSIVPSNSVAALDGTSNAGLSNQYSRGDHKHSDANRPTDDEKAALIGSFGTPSASNKYVTEDDPEFNIIWSVLTNGNPSSPELVFDSAGDVIMTTMP